MDSAKSKQVYRVRQLPREVKDRFQAANLLVTLEPRLGPVENISLSDLTTDADIWDKKKLKSTTATFSRLPPLLEDSTATQWTINARRSGVYPHDVLLDSQFLDFTVLNDVAPSEHVADCIVISGLASHAFGSWRQRDSEFMWVRDQLPFDLPELRNIIYGYDTRLLNSTSFQNVDDLARTLVRKLKGIGRSSLNAKPLIFCLHSLGGIIFKKALLLLAAYGDVERQILDSIAAILFFGVPSRGMSISHLLPMVKGQPNRELVELLQSGSPELEDLDIKFQGIVRRNNIRVICFYKTKMSATNKQEENGDWSRGGPEEILVPRNSAVLEVSLESDRIPINEDHSNMVKFAPSDQNYAEVRSSLREVTSSLNSIVMPESPAATIPADSISRKARKRRPLVDELQSTIPNTNSSEGAISHCSSPDADDGDMELRGQMMDSLRIERPYERLEQVEISHENTFSWIYSDISTGFISWLTSEQGLYWINGKPGSGKSTMMKYIYNNNLTWETMPGGSRDRIVAAFFFHNRGGYLQKSFEGLYRSIICQIIEAHTELQTLVLQKYIQQNRESQKHWSLSDLEDAFQCIIMQDHFPVKIFLFLDALDEYDGTREFIADFVKLAATRSARSTTKIQILFSSRPWNVFQDYFQDQLSLCIQDHTKSDIRQYALDKINDNTPLKNIITSFNRQNVQEVLGLVEELVQKAEGVFLWVALAIKEMTKACREGVLDFHDITRKLRDLPEGLDEFYTRIISQLPTALEIRDETFIMLEIVLRTRHTLTLVDFWTALRCSRCRTLQECRQRVGWINIPESQENLERQIKNRCGGLLEGYTLNSPGSNPTVQFMHQTVKEFVGRPDFGNLVLGNGSTASLRNGHDFLTKSTITEMIENTGSRLGYDDHLVNAMYHARLSEITLGISQYNFLESISNELLTPILHQHRAIFNDVENSNLSQAVLVFGVVSDLQLYMDKKLKSQPVANQRLEKSLLHYAVGVMVSYEASKIVPTTDLSQMVNILLHNGADKSAVFNGLTPFQSLFLRCREGFSGVGGSPLSDAEIQTISIFLKHEQDPNSDIRVHHLSRRGRILRLTCKPLHVVDSPLVRILMDYGANVNMLDSEGRTPLDIAYGVGWKVFQIGKCRNPIEAYALVMTFLNYGGCVTNATFEKVQDGKTALVLFLEIMSEHFNIDSKMKDPPLLTSSTNPLNSVFKAV